jgi:hypothetical protein
VPLVDQTGGNKGEAGVHKRAQKEKLACTRFVWVERVMERIVEPIVKEHLSVMPPSSSLVEIDTGIRSPRCEEAYCTLLGGYRNSQVSFWHNQSDQFTNGFKNL